jgi:hypothetical protein
MTAPRGKGIYARDPDFYPGADPAGYAALMGCSFVAFLNHATSDEQIQRAKQLGLDAYLWAGPHWWLPHNWARTLDSQAERVMRMGLDGFIADAEFAVKTMKDGKAGWRGHRSEREQLGQRLADASLSLPSVGFTSFPSWYIDDLVVPGSRVWGSPQIYGLQSLPAGEVRAVSQRWWSAFREVVPSLAAWDRSPAEQEQYLASFARQLRGSIFWQKATGKGTGARIIPQPGTEAFNVLRDWSPVNWTGLLVAWLERAGHPVPFERVV